MVKPDFLFLEGPDRMTRRDVICYLSGIAIALPVGIIIGLALYHFAIT